MRFNPKALNLKGFNTQPPEGGWVYFFGAFVFFSLVSTHSRLKAAGYVPHPVA